MGRLGRPSRLRRILAIAFIAFATTLGFQFVKAVAWGGDPTTQTVSDWTYYRAMAEAPLTDPRAVSWWLQQPDFSELKTSVEYKYGATSLHSAYLHEENGFANQPPFAYRILVPWTVSILIAAGFSPWWSFLVIQAAGIAVFAIFCIGSFSMEWKMTRTSAVVVAASTFAIVFNMAPYYVDSVFIGLSMAALWAARNDRSGAFFVAGFLASATRETGFALALVWVLDSVARTPRRSPLASLWPAVGPIAGLVLARAMVTVANSDTAYGVLIDALAGNLAIGILALVGLSLISPAPLVILRGSLRALKPLDSISLLVAFLTSMAATVLATGTVRMVSLILPLLVAPSAWQHVRSSWWLAVALMAGVGFALSDDFSARFDVDNLATVSVWVLATCGMAVAAAAREPKESPQQREPHIPRQE